MNFGVTLPCLGPAAQPDLLARFSRRAEELGYATLWVADRLLFPLHPRSPYPGAPDGALPDFYRRSLDPVATLTWAAAHTSRIELATGVLQMPLYNPILLARELTTLDILSGGRLVVGLGQGWSLDEFEAAGADPKARGERADEFLGVLRAVWAGSPAEFQGRHFRLPPSVLAQPVRRPPLLLAAYAPAALRRIALLADGWMPVGVPIPALTQNWSQVREEAAAAGRDPDALQLRVAGFVTLTAAPLDADRPAFTGSEEQVAGDLAAVRALGAREFVFMFLPEHEGDVDGLETLEKFRALAATLG